MEPTPPDWPPDLANYWRTLESGIDGTAEHILELAANGSPRRKELIALQQQPILQQWEQGWTYFDAVIFAMEQNGLQMLERSGLVHDHFSSTRDALSLLHASATMVLHEIQTLLKGGLWVGGAARWRTLHELSVTAILIAKDSTGIAQRYLDHGFVVQTKRLADFYFKHGRAVVAEDELRKRWEAAERLIETHSLPDQSSSFASQYGWAIPLMGRRKDGKYLRPTFDSLEKIAGLENQRLLVDSSNGHVHNDASGIRSAVLMEDGYWSLGPIPRFTETVARPTFLSVIHMVSATHLGFEPELNEFSRLLGLLAGGLCRVASLGMEAFETASSQ
ncbi:DUF5677 domain-containing protein [Arthrobacter sp. UYCu723]